MGLLTQLVSLTLSEAGNQVSTCFPGSSPIVLVTDIINEIKSVLTVSNDPLVPAEVSPDVSKIVKYVTSTGRHRSILLPEYGTGIIDFEPENITTLTAIHNHAESLQGDISGIYSTLFPTKTLNASEAKAIYWSVVYLIVTYLSNNDSGVLTTDLEAMFIPAN